MSFDNLLIADDGAIRSITINRPDKLNALNGQTIAELHQAFAEARTEESVRVIILAGAGPKAFVAGADISELDTATPVQMRDLSRAGQDMMRLVETLGKPVIARIQGFALGGGMELAMACSLRIASDQARMGQPEINLGLLPGFGGTQRLVRLCGRSAALELCLLGTPIKAQRAHELGRVQQVVAAESLDETVNAVAQQLARSAPHALRGILDAIIIGADAPLEVGLSYETQAFGLCAASEDKAEGTRAFLEKRKPEFKGR